MSRTGSLSAYECLVTARVHHTQNEVVEYLGGDIRPIRRWEARQIEPPRYVVRAI